MQINISPNLPPLISDLSRLQYVPSELLDNTCNYTPSGEKITVIANASPSIIQLSVSNSGVEILTDELKRIFEKFYRIPNKDSSK